MTSTGGGIMGRPLPRIPRSDGGFRVLWILVAAVIALGCLIGYLNHQAADQGGEQGATSTHPQRVPSPTVPNDR